MRRVWLTILLLVPMISGAVGLAACEDMCADHKRLVAGICRSSPPECGSEPPGSCWEQCSYLNPSVCWTVCTSGDEGCRCWDGSHCQGGCISDASNCAGERVEGECSSTTASWELGCHCYVVDGLGQYTCSD